MNIHNFILQFAFLYAPLIHPPMEQVSPYIFRGCDPKIKDIYLLHDKGIKTIVSIRLNPELKKQRLCQKLNMNWAQIKTGVFLTPTDEQFDQFRAIINDKKNQPCYVSCEIGMDRAGIYLAAYRLVDQNWSIQQVNDDFKMHHQKTWWPVFRKYKNVAIAYAIRRRGELADSVQSH